ncbi:hypothetical protein JL721_5189 [Aureococcus anophagefferens]|nr:hypothetical protein JL721_5189 [Aureococcus anophagefferens]
MGGSLRELVAGGAGGASMVVVGHPLDTVKVRMQASDGYRSALHCVIRTSRAEGPLALYKGMIMPLGATSAVFALCFSGYEHGKRLLGSGGAPSVREAALAGAFSALYWNGAPQELLKCRMQKATGRVTVRAAFGELWASGGLAALSRGFSVTLARDAAASAVYFATYVWTKRELARVPAFRGDDGRASFLGVFAAGAAAGVMNWVPAIPLDFLKTRYQVDPTYTGAFLGRRPVAAEVLAADGVRGVFRGTQAIFLRAVPANAACFGGYEACVRAFDTA